MKTSTSSSVSLGFVELLQVAFIVLKLCKVIDWSWWWVLAPTWISGGLLIIFIIVFVLWNRHIRKKW